MDWILEARRAVASASVDLIRNNTVIGIGSGRTVWFVIQALETKVKKENFNIRVVPTSTQTETLCVEKGLPLTNLSENPELDLAIDGADQVELKTLNLVKGAGGALTREKIVASAARKFAIVVDQKKIAKRGLCVKVPVEVVPFGTGYIGRELIRIGGKPKLRERDGKLGPVITDNGNYILDVDFREIRSPERLERRLRSLPGVVETGLFLRMADIVYVGRRDGTVQILRRKK
jgi:ribose 5-phosphate isomerase A